jgi:hypothetical protein
MKLSLLCAGAGDRRRIAKIFTAFLVLAGTCLSLAPQIFAQSQSLAVNRALVSSGVPAVPPTSPVSRLQTGESASVAIALGAAPPIALATKQGIFGLVGVSPDQLVQITVQYPALKTGRPIIAEALDGGQIIAPTTIVVGLDHAIHFQFRAAHTPGFNHIALHEGSREVGLQFWVMDAQHPERKPPVVNP